MTTMKRADKRVDGDVEAAEGHLQGRRSAADRPVHSTAAAGQSDRSVSSHADGGPQPGLASCRPTAKRHRRRRRPINTTNDAKNNSMVMAVVTPPAGGHCGKTIVQPGRSSGGSASREAIRATASAKAEARSPKDSLESRFRCALMVGLTMVKRVCTGRAVDGLEVDGVFQETEGHQRPMRHAG